jgi:hydroxymethylbilane synthase
MAENGERPHPSTADAGSIRSIRIGTRGSRLAQWQARYVAERLERQHPGLKVELVEIKTLGDRDRSSPLAAIGEIGLFTKEIQRALAEGAVDLAVHSLKDLPTQGPGGLVLAAVPPRESTADALVAPVHRSLDALPRGACVGTSSLRRAAQLRSVRADLVVVPVRGNVETRIRQAVEGGVDAVVLAEAGLRRLGLEEVITERLGPPRMFPAVGQGALGIECRAADVATIALARHLDDVETHRAVLAERALLSELGGGCLIPLGALAQARDGGVSIEAALFDVAGTRRIFASIGPSDDPEALGRAAADRLREQGAAELIDAVRSHLGEYPSAG